MLALRNRSIVAVSGPFWLSALCVALAPTTIGYQDLAALLGRQPGIAERWRDHLIASPFGTIHAAMFSFSRPIGTIMSETAGVEPVSFDPRSLDVKVWIGNGSSHVRPALQVEYPTVNRRLKGDRMPAPQTSPASSGTESAPAQPINAPATQPAPPPPAPVMGPRPKSVERLDAVPAEPEASIEAFGTLPSESPHDDDVPNWIAPNANVPMSAFPRERNEARDADADDDIVLADKPPEIPAPGESERSPVRLAVLLRRGCGRAQHPALFWRRRHGCTRRTGKLAARRRACSGVAAARSGHQAFRVGRSARYRLRRRDHRRQG